MRAPKFQVGERVIPTKPCLLMTGVIQSFEPIDLTEDEWRYVILMDKHPAATQCRIMRHEKEIERIYQFGIGAEVVEYNIGIGAAVANLQQLHLTT